MANGTKGEPVRLDDRFLLRLALVLGLIGAACGILGDYYLTFTPAVPGGVPYEWDSVLELVRNIPHGRLAAGHYFGVFGMQLSVWGFFAVLYGARPAGRSWVLPPLFVVLFIYFVGCAYHGQLALLGSALQMADHAGLAQDPATQRMIDEHKHLMWRQLTAVEIGIGFLSLWLPAVVLLRPTVYPRWFALLSPFLVMGVFVGLAKLLAPEPVRMFVEMTVFNLVSFLLIAIASIFLWNTAPLAAE
jgi:hypothetical protein